MKLFPFLLVASLLTSSAQADLTGRLFLTPQQRAMLDRARQRHAAAETAGHSDAAGVTLNGIVKRSDGRSTLWLNDRPYDSDHPATAGTRITGKQGLGYTLRLPDSGQVVRLKVGQRFDPASGKVEETTVNPAAAGDAGTPSGSEATNPTAAPAAAPGTDARPAAPQP